MSGRESDVIVRDVNKLLEDSIKDAQLMIGKSYASMDKSDKQRFIKYLDDRGIFLISKQLREYVNYWILQNVHFITI